MTLKLIYSTAPLATILASLVSSNLNWSVKYNLCLYSGYPGWHIDIYLVNESDLTISAQSMAIFLNLAVFI